MSIEYNDREYEFVSPDKSEKELVVKVQKYTILPFRELNDKDRFCVLFIVKKAIYFVLREGIKLALNKIKAYKRNKDISSKRQVVFVFGFSEELNSYVIALGPQDCPQSEFLNFRKELTYKIEPDRNVEKDLRSIMHYFKEKPEELNSLFYYSSYSGFPLELELEKIICTDYDQQIKIEEQLDDKVIFIEPITKQKPRKRKRRPISIPSSKYTLFLTGAGAYAQSYILPNLRSFFKHTIIDLNPITAILIGEKYGFKYKDSSSARAFKRLQECTNPILVIASYHSTHFPLVEEALRYNHKTKILIEKPPITTIAQLDGLISLREDRDHFIEIGYNRRHSPLIKKAKEIIAGETGPITMTCIVKELNIPLSHWYYWPTQGTRVTGNLCHWIDLGIYFIQKDPVAINAASVSPHFPADEISVSIEFSDGSLLTLIASDRGNRLRGVQEYINIRRSDITITIDDFVYFRMQKGNKQRTIRKIHRNKGHKKMYTEFVNAIYLDHCPIYPNWDLKTSTRLYLELTDMLLSGEKYHDIRNKMA